MIDELIELAFLRLTSDPLTFIVHDRDASVNGVQISFPEGSERIHEEYFRREGLSFWPDSSPREAAARMFVAEIVMAISAIDPPSRALVMSPTDGGLFLERKDS